MKNKTEHKYFCENDQPELVRTKDIHAVEMTSGLSAALTASLDAAYSEYYKAAIYGEGNLTQARAKIAAIPEPKRYLTRILDSMDAAFADFDEETVKLDLPFMEERTPQKIREYLEFRLLQISLLMQTIASFAEQKRSTKPGGRA